MRDLNETAAEICGRRYPIVINSRLRLYADLVAAQLAIIETQMVTFDQVMLPYLRTDDGTTMFERYVAQRALTAGGA